MSSGRAYDRHVSVTDDGFDASLVLTVWADLVGDVKQTIRIPVEDIPEFIRDVVDRGAHALSTAARRLEVGHCETCGNTGLVSVERSGRATNDYCPDCRPRWPSHPFANAPHIGRLARGTGESR